MPQKGHTPLKEKSTQKGQSPLTPKDVNVPIEIIIPYVIHSRTFSPFRNNGLFWDVGPFQDDGPFGHHLLSRGFSSFNKQKIRVYTIYMMPICALLYNSNELIFITFGICVYFWSLYKGFFQFFDEVNVLVYALRQGTEGIRKKRKRID